ncbi:MAG: hypothetical protein M3401_10885, partial [Actinomycetota bacterium]|nr:hypothetical protein [Actinomycetota bacterium]
MAERQAAYDVQHLDAHEVGSMDAGAVGEHEFHQPPLARTAQQQLAYSRGVEDDQASRWRLIVSAGSSPTSMGARVANRVR